MKLEFFHANPMKQTSMFNKSNLFNHGNYIWEIDNEKNKAIIRNIVNHEEYKYLRQTDFELGKGPYSFFFQDNYGVICNEGSNQVWIIEGDCYSTNYTPKTIKTIETFEWNKPSLGILSPDNRFLLFAVPTSGYRPLNIKNCIVLVDLHNSTEKALNEFNIRETINKFSFKEDYLIINEKNTTKDITTPDGANSIIIKNWRKDLSPLVDWEEKQIAYYELGWYHLLCPAYINKFNRSTRDKVINWIERVYGEEWKNGDQVTGGDGDKIFMVDFPDKK